MGITNIFRVAALVLALFQSSAWATDIDLAKTKSSVEFLAIGKPSAIRIHGKSKEGPTNPLSGKLVLTDGKLSGKALLPLESLETGIALRDEHMKKKYLEVDKWPTASLTLSPFSLSEATANFEGTLTLHGKTNPIAGKVEIKKKENPLELSFQFKVVLESFGIETPAYLGIKVTEAVLTTVQISTR